jgi:dTDP-4-amino-4,6-dideoxygalactose transaminase
VNGSNAVSFLDLVTPHKELREELRAVFEAALDTAGFIGGPAVQSFEATFAAYSDAKHCVGVGSGTDALRFALIAAGVGAGDIVVTVPNTFIATTEAISQSGALPVFVDVDEATYNMDAAKLREYFERDCIVDSATGLLRDKARGKRIAAVIPVHLYGQMADMDALLELGEKYNFIVVEDACQAHGAQYFSKKQNRWCTAGSMGLAGAFSFYPGKNLGACGEGGAITTNDADLAAKMRMLRDHGQAKKYYHDIEGFNGRLDAMQAGFLSVKMKHLPDWTKARQNAAARYQALFAKTGTAQTGPGRIGLPFEPEWSRAVYHLFVVRVENRDEFMKQMGEAGIATGIHYPIPLHLQKAYTGLGYKQGDFPVAERVSLEIVSLPMFPQLTAEQQERVVKEAMNVVSEKVAG